MLNFDWETFNYFMLQEDVQAILIETLVILRKIDKLEQYIRRYIVCSLYFLSISFIDENSIFFNLQLHYIAVASNDFFAFENNILALIVITFCGICVFIEVYILF